MQPTRGLGSAPLPPANRGCALLFGLAPGGVCRVSLRPRGPASSLWHWSSPHGGRALPATLRWGARTFLTPHGCPSDARPSGRLAGSRIVRRAAGGPRSRSRPEPLGVLAEMDAWPVRATSSPSRTARPSAPPRCGTARNAATRRASPSPDAATVGRSAARPRDEQDPGPRRRAAAERHLRERPGASAIRRRRPMTSSGRSCRHRTTVAGRRRPAEVRRRCGRP